MTDPTPTDRTKAAELLRCTTLGFDPRAAEVDRIAAALTEARAPGDKLRADVLDLANKLSDMQPHSIPRLIALRLYNLLGVQP